MSFYSMNNIHGINLNRRGVTGGGTPLSSLEVSKHSVALYWVTMHCGWVGGGALGCPALEAAPK